MLFRSNLTQHGFQTNPVAEVTLPWDEDVEVKTKNKKRVFTIGCLLLAGKDVPKADREFYSRECKCQCYHTLPPPEVRLGDAKGTQVSQGMDDESIDDHVMSDDLADCLFHIAGGMGKHNGHLATNRLTRSSASCNVAVADTGGGIGADDAGDADIRLHNDSDEDNGGDGNNSSELTDPNA